MKFASASNEERLGFVQKVYGIIALQVGVTASFCFLALVNETFLSILHNSFLCVMSAVGLLVITLMLACSKDMRSSVPRNYILLLLFTIFEGHMVALVCNKYDSETVAMALVLTTGISLIVTGYAMTTKTDYTISVKVLLTLFAASLVVGIMGWFWHTREMELLSCFTAIAISSFYILYDTQKLLGNSACKFDLDDYILAALNIYLDIIRLFLDILKILDKVNEDKKKRK
eukprot:TRINITY_DN6264_c0_g2_i2.p1 TRINITY_DN6264_c0_g2~~TRINITY_DN6264_c0_g2_i2.p1  ORF type:complete len:230 (-),score=40.85 TRINITY_DN6264_c0_g2_i2:162-851(-)